ncbi:MAG: STAS domain-containing protein [Butyrivibrio sp.]|jgi:anti-sigma B factor antagonist|nr:STAS domain-containing protein [Butyrivibrio sp.]
MTITKEKNADVLTVTIEGNLDINTAPKLTEALNGELDDVNQVIFDLEKTDYTSSAGLRVILGAYQVLDKKEGKMLLKNVHDSFYDILQMSGFTDFLDIERS